MNKLLCFAVLACVFTANAQYQEGPWMSALKKKTSPKEMQSKDPNQPFTFKEVQQAFNAYWKDKDHTQKGCGYKPQPFCVWSLSFQ